jgi:hypothetical protein
MGDRKRQQGLLVAVGVAVAVLSLPAVASAKTLAKSTFKDSAEKWRIVGDTATDPEKPDFIATGGDPGGFIQAVDQAVGGVMYWRAPKAFLGNQKDAFGGTLSYSFQQSATDTQFDDEDIVLEGHGLTLSNSAVGSPPATPDWSTVTATLKGSSWQDDTNNDGVTRREFKRVLGDLDELQIRAEYRTGDDTDGLDSVFLKTP